MGWLRRELLHHRVFAGGLDALGDAGAVLVGEPELLALGGGGDVGHAVLERLGFELVGMIRQRHRGDEITMLGLLLVGLGWLAGMGVGVSMTVLATMITSVTLLPALLSLAGERVEITREGERIRAEVLAQRG